MDVSCHRPFLPGTSLEPAAIPTAQVSSLLLLLLLLLYLGFNSVAVALTLVQAKQIRINIHQRNNTKT